MTQVQGGAANMDAVSGGNGAGVAVSLWRLYILRALYAVMAAAEGSTQLQAFLHHAHWTPSDNRPNSRSRRLADTQNCRLRIVPPLPKSGGGMTSS